MVRHLIKLSILIIVGQIVQATPLDKWQNLGDFGTIFIEEEQKYNWFQASNECAMRNLTLITVETSEKNAAILAILRKQQFDIPLNFWMGGNDLGEEGTFVWSATGKRFEYSDWLKGQPSNAQDQEHCAHYWSNYNFEWNDAPCDGRMGFICEENRFLAASRRDLEIKKNFIHQLFAL